MDIFFDKTIECFKYGQRTGVFPGGVISIGNKNGVLRREFVGYRSLYPTKQEINIDTIFDIASMSKIVSTTMIVLKFLELNIFNLEDSISEFFDVPKDKKEIKIKHLLTHTSGLNPYFDLSKTVSDFNKCLDAILNSKLEASAGESVIYSCMGYILLGFILEKVSNIKLEDLANKYVFRPLEMINTTYRLDDKSNVAYTEYDNEIGNYIHGIVHDENARFLNGVSGNAGVFSTIKDLEKFTLMLLNNGYAGEKKILDCEILEYSTQNHTKGLNDCRGLGFLLSDGSELSPAGKGFSNGSYGHTGFTGTSLWIDKELGIYILMLTNRVHPTRDNNKIINFRRVINEILINELKESVKLS